MKMWSRGLGRTELNLNPVYCQIKKDPESGNVFIYGQITDPVNWEFRGVILPEDIPGIFKLAMTWGVISLVLKNIWRYVAYLFKPNKHETGENLEQKVGTAYEQIFLRNAKSAGPAKRSLAPVGSTRPAQAQAAANV